MDHDEFEHPMSAEEFRRYGYALIDMIADYHQNIPTPVSPVGMQPGDLLARLPDSGPYEPEDFQNCIDDLKSLIIPSLTHWLSPNYFAYYPCNSSFPGILGELVSAGLGQQGMMWLTSPACTELEIRTLDWLAEALRLPPEFFHRNDQGGGVIQGSASEALLVALISAREKKLSQTGNNCKENLVAYCSDQTHSSMKKACRILGFDEHQLRILPTQNGAMNTESLKEALNEDVTKGRVPFFVVATIGTTSSASVDPVREIGIISEENKIWMHIDAAYAGSACICPEYRPLLDGVEFADSFNFNPHKWLLVTFDCSVLFVRDKEALTQALSVTPEYLRNKATESGVATDFRDWQIPLGRRIRALKLWFVIRSYGISGLQDFIRHGVDLATQFEKSVKGESRLQLVLPRSFALVCFRVAQQKEGPQVTEAKTRELMERINEKGEVFLTHTSLMGQFVLRASFGGQYTKAKHVDGLFKAICKELDAMGLED